MTSFFITTTARDTPWYPWAHSNYLRIYKAAENSEGTKYTLANHPREADIILFVEAGRPFQSDILISPIYRAYPDKSVVLDFADNAFPILPGLYVGLSREQSRNDQYQGGFYIRVAENKLFTSFENKPIEPELLFSFIGRVQNHTDVRGRILALKHPRAVIRNQTSNQSDDDISYVETLYRSKFVLAPRGYGPSSWRLFETLRAGRVPVIVSDDWVAPAGVAWEEISVRVPESGIKDIPDILESLESVSGEMGKKARKEWERCFSLANGFEWISSRLEEVVNSRQNENLGFFGLLGKMSTFEDRLRFIKEKIAVRTGH